MGSALLLKPMTASLDQVSYCTQYSVVMMSLRSLHGGREYTALIIASASFTVLFTCAVLSDSTVSLLSAGKSLWKLLWSHTAVAIILHNDTVATVPEGSFLALN